MVPTRTQVLRLYKDLLRYGEMLTLTDKKYYKSRIKEEFYENKNIGSEEIEFLYEIYELLLKPQRQARTIDKPKLPEIKDHDLEEKFVKGSGPGGQKVNKGNNCVYLLHKPSGLSVKVHESRLQQQNRKIARERLTTMLDNFINGDDSVENQKKQILEEKSRKSFKKNKKFAQMKSNWKKMISELP